MRECPHGGDPNCCPPCQNPPAGRRLTTTVSPPPRVDGVLTAAYRSDCDECMHEIVPGDPIGQLELTTRGRTVRRVWVHAHCAGLEVAL